MAKRVKKRKQDLMIGETTKLVGAMLGVATIPAIAGKL